MQPPWLVTSRDLRRIRVAAWEKMWGLETHKGSAALFAVLLSFVPSSINSTASDSSRLAGLVTTDKRVIRQGLTVQCLKAAPRRGCVIVPRKGMEVCPAVCLLTASSWSEDSRVGGGGWKCTRQAAPMSVLSRGTATGPWRRLYNAISEK